MAKLYLASCLLFIVNCALVTSAGINENAFRNDVNSSTNYIDDDVLGKDMNSSANFKDENAFGIDVNSSTNSTPGDTYEYASYTDGNIRYYFLLNRVGLIIIVILAVFGNTVIIIVLTKKRNRSFTTSMYLISLAISDIILVVFNPLLTWLDEVFGINVIFPIVVQCKVFTAWLYGSSMNASWTLAAIAIERVISVTIPHKVKIICSPYNAKRVVFGIWLAFFMLSVCLAITFDNYGDNDCVFINEFFSFYIFDLSIINLVFMIPFLIILVSTVIILIQLFKIKKRKMSTKSFDIWQITLTLVFTNIAFIVTVMPINIVFMVYKIQGFLGVQQIGNIYHLMNVFRFLLYLNSCLNFFIYFLSGSKFRAEVKKLFTFNKKTLLPTRGKVSTSTT